VQKLAALFSVLSAAQFNEKDVHVLDLLAQNAERRVWWKNVGRAESFCQRLGVCADDVVPVRLGTLACFQRFGVYPLEPTEG